MGIQLSRVELDEYFGDGRVVIQLLKVELDEFFEMEEWSFDGHSIVA